MFWYVPLEVLEERYTEQMYRWVCADLDEAGVEFRVVHGVPLVKTTEGGQFLSWASRVHFASMQMAAIAEAFQDSLVKDGDVFFFADMWHPGMEGVPYMATLMGIDVKVYAINYAGPFDKTDLTCPLLSWGQYQEAAWYGMCEAVFVGSESHKKIIQAGLRESRLPMFHNIIVTGLVWKKDEVISRAAQGKLNGAARPIVIWPHRISSDKNLPQFVEIVNALKDDYPEVRWIISSGREGQQYTPPPGIEFIAQSKNDYYHMLSRAVLMVSTAYHENFGYTVYETTALGTPVLCPRRADYPETILTENNLYTTTSEAIDKTHLAIRGMFEVAILKQFGGFSLMLSIMLSK